MALAIASFRSALNAISPCILLSGPVVCASEHAALLVTPYLYASGVSNSARLCWKAADATPAGCG